MARTLNDLKQHARWADLKPVVYEGARNAVAGEYTNPYPDGTLRWHAFEIGHDLAVKEVEKEFPSTNQPT